jgi:predicted permease
MGFWHKLGNTLRPGSVNHDVASELEHHRALRREDGLGAWRSPGADGATRDADILVWLESWLLDLRHAARLLRRSPAFTLLVVASLALGIGANAAIFSLIDTVLLRTLPVPLPNQIYLLQSTDGVRPVEVFSYPVFLQMQRAAAGRAQLGAYDGPGQVPLERRGGRALEPRTQLVSGGFFRALAIAPWRGRWIDADDNRALGASPVAVLSYGFWRRVYGGTPMVGRTITLHHTPLTVVGVAPPGFTGLDPEYAVDIWAPIMMQPALGPGQGSIWSYNADDKKPYPPQEGEMWLHVFARLRDPGQAPALAAALSLPLAASFRRFAPEHKLAQRVALVPGGRGGNGLRKQYAAPLTLLMAMAAMMLLIAVANVATLQLARMVRRQREIAVRVAIGVSRARLARQLLTEGLLLASIASAAAAGVALAATRLILRLAGDPFASHPDWRMWAFLAVVALGVGLILGVLPARQALRGTTAADLKSAGLRAAAGAPGRVPLGRQLVVAQVAFSLVLVVAAGLFARSLAAMFTLNLGFDRDHILTASLALPDAGVPIEPLRSLDHGLLRRIAALPGVRAVAVDQSGLDDYSTDTSGIHLAGVVSPPGGLYSNENTVSRRFFHAVGMPILRGRGFAATDTANSPTVVVVNQAFAARFYPGQDPLGKTFGYNAAHTGQFRIVGVVADARVNNPDTPAVPLFYRLMDQSARAALHLEVRAAGDPARLISAVRATAGSFDPRLRVEQVSTVTHRLGEMLRNDTLVMQLSAGAGLLALALACLGLFGVTAYTVNARRSEFGVRLALGANRGAVVQLVLGEAAAMLGLGAALGLPLAFAAARWAQPLLPGVSASDPAALAAALAVTLTLPLLAALVPARRAARTDPALALRAE